MFKSNRLGIIKYNDKFVFHEYPLSWYWLTQFSQVSH